MQLKNMLQDLCSQGLEWRVNKDKLSFSDPNKVLTIEHKNILKENKQKVIELLTTENDIFTSYPLSYNQLSLWFIYQEYPKNSAYNTGYALRILSPINIDIWKEAFANIMARHSSLRTRYNFEEGEIKQQVHPYLPIDLQVINLENQNQNNLVDIVKKEHQKPFTLEKDTVIRVRFFKNSESDYVLLLTIHHIAIDAFSIGQVLDEAIKTYIVLEKGEQPDFISLKLNYSDFVTWQKNHLEQEGTKLLGYWKNKLQKTNSILELPIDFPRPTTRTYNGNSYNFQLKAETTILLKEFAKKHNITLYSTILAIFNVWLYKYTDQENITVGTPIMGRSDSNFQNTVGYFVNVVPIYNKCQHNISFSDFAKQVHQTTLEAMDYQDYPFTLLVKNLNIDRSTSHSPIFQTMFTLQESYTLKHYLELSIPGKHVQTENLHLAHFPFTDIEGQFDLVLDAIEADNIVYCSFKYDVDLFLTETIERWSQSFQTFVGNIVSYPSCKISELEVLTEKEKNKIIYKWNDTECDFPQNKCIHELFEEQVERTPDAIAVVCGEEQLTYRELNEKANQLAHYLVEQGAKGLNIGIIFEKSEKVVIYALSILKSGGIYIPIDPITPKERIHFIINDAKISFVMTNEKYLSLVPDHVKTVCFESSNLYPINNLNLKIMPKFLAYIIYTSGSTGMPKGVAISHLSLINTIYTYSFFYQQKPVKELIVTSFAFDVSVRQIFSNILHGNIIHIAKEETLNSQDLLYSYIKSHKISLLDFSPSFFSIIRKKIEMAELLDLKYLILGAEALAWDIIDNIKDKIEVFNMYGPTECSVDTHIYHIKKKINSSFVPIGKVKDNSQSYLLDNNFLPVPIGVVGEIYIGGAGLARSYINRPGLTAEQFVPHPFSKKEGERLYKTGDLARYLPDGNIEFIGRKDHQVKIRGFRIELGEIEANLLEHKNIKETVVIVREDTAENKMIVAYIVVSSKENTNIEDLRNYLKNKLPEYMIPSAFVVLDKLPLTPNGKVDRKALPKPDFAIEKVVKAKTPVEEIIVNVWQKLLILENVGVEDNFFHVGGHSLLATQLVSRLSKTLQKEISIRDVFLYPTIREIAAHLEKKNRTIEKLAITKADRSQNLPLSFAQQRLWFLDKLEGASANYNMPGALKFIGKLDIAKLEKALQYIVMRHEVLRTHFIEVENGAVQVIHNDAFTLQIKENTNLEEIHSQIEIETHRPFDLGKDTLLRAIVYKVAEEDWVLFVNMHHIISDGWSIGIFMRELATLYNALQQKDTCELDTVLPALKIQYADFALWQREWLQGKVLEKQLGYWQQQLANTPTMLDLPTDKPRPAIQTYNGDHIGFEIEPEITQKLQQLCNEEGVTMFMCVYAAFACLLARYSNQEDIVIGTPIANRNIEETEELIGFFVNTLALRVNLASNPTFLELLKEVRTITLEAYNHQDVPFEYLVDRLAPERNMSHSPIFQVMLAWQNFAENDLVLNGLEIELVESTYKIAKFDITLSVQESGGRLSGSLEYNTDLFLLETMQQFLAHFKNILSEIVGKPQQKISSLEILSKQEQQKIVYEWNNTECDFPQNKCIHELFEEQVEKTPDAIAVVCGEEQLTYRELNDKANQLAHYLLKQGVKEEVLVGIYLERSINTIVSMLGILKAGAGYIPLDTLLPQERIKHIHEISKFTFLLCDEEKINVYLANVNICNMKKITIDASKINPKREINNTNNIYTIFTSGSTGKPKGVSVSHKSVINFTNFMKKELKIAKNDIWLAITVVTFDIANLEIYLPLLVGSKVVFAKNTTGQDPDLILKMIENEKVSFLQATPSTWKMLRDRNFTLKEVKGICGGEALSENLVVYLKENLCTLWNVYGPTETTIWSSYIKIVNNELSIGKPIDNTEIYILNNNLQPVPIGVVGEIYIGGAGLARGYINRPGSTAERFVPHPFGKKRGERLYKTGDLARYLPDGNIEFIGRKDHQVKIRGFRIELGEIEANLLEHKNVKETVAIVREDTAENKMIVAYIVVSSKENTNIEDLRNYLKNKLPEYMIPSAFVVLDKLPLTPNGKVDRKALPKPDFAIEKMVKAKTPVEEIIVNVWQKLLALENVGVEDNFFHVGGHSLLATQLVSRLSKTLQKEISIRDVFLYPTIREIAAHLEKKNRTIEKLAITKADRSQNLPLSFAQQRLWFLDKLEGASANYNMPGALKFIGKLDIAKLEKALQYIVMRHEVLRTHFIEVENGVVQVIHNDAFTLQIKENTNLEEIHSQIEIETHRPFDLGKDTLLRAIVYKVAEEDWVLFVNMHHIISDGWSIGIFMRELATLYNALQQKDTCELDTVLPALKVQYADFALWQREWLQGKVLEEQLGYWQQQLANIPTKLDLPTDKPRPAIQTYNGDHIVFEIEPEVTIKLQQLCNEEGVTMFMCVYAAFACLLARYSNQEDIVIGTPIANRNIEETEELIGFFVNTLVLRVNLENNPTFLELLREVRRTTLEAYNHQDVPFEYLVDRLAPERNMSHSPIFQVMLAWQNFAQNDLVLDNLEIEVVESPYKIAKFDITLFMQEKNGQIQGSLEYNTDLFLPETMQQFLAHFKNILSQIVEKSQQRALALEILNKQEQQKIVYEWNNTECDFPQNKCIHELFEEQVDKTPDAIAVVCGEEQLTYHELNEKANQLAVYLLQEQKITTNEVVGVALEKTIDLAVSIIGILKAGAVYLPLDINYPESRQKYMVEVTQTKTIIIHSDTKNIWGNVNLIKCEEIKKNYLQTCFKKIDYNNKNIAYILFTSGSTGTPKGVEMPHKALVNLIHWHKQDTRLSQSSKTLGFAPISFDVSFQEMFSAWTTGGTIYFINDDKKRDFAEVLKFIKKNKIERIFLPYVALKQLLKQMSEEKKYAICLKDIITAGEQLRIDQETKDTFRQIQAILHNHYGPTESHVITSYTLEQKIDNWESLPSIGKPIANSNMYILNNNLQSVPIGTMGEIYIGGAGLARGYINRPGLTAERFIPNPFSKKEGERLYKTGDLARYLPDGNIEFIGRKDHQVKVRGFRIELGEIEANLLEHKNVKEIVVIVREDTAENKMIVAYIVVSDKENTDIEDLRNYLKNKLPEYMIPSAFVVLDKLPLTPNGKVDRKALPKPDFAIEKVVKAKTPVEEIIVNVWQKLLTLESVGVEDNFFHVGGHSLLATQLMSRLSKTVQKEISIRDIFLYPTIREMAAHLEKKNRTIEKPAIEKADKSQNLPLSFAQQRLWFLDKLEGASANYNMPGALKFIGKLDIAKLEKALQCIVMRHEVLRTHFIEVEDGTVQVIHNDAFTLQVEKNTNLEEIHRQIEIETHRPFDLSKDMLLRTIVYKVTEEEWILFVNMHHIISDGWSIGIFMRELATLYNALQQKDTCELDTVLPALKVQYADFALWQREWLQGNVLETQLGYWQQQLANIPTMLDLPTDKPRPVIQTYNGNHIVFEIEPEVTIKLQQLCNEEGVTMFMCVYAAFACLLARYSNQEDIVIGTPIANRNIEETEELIGFFVNTLALRVNLANNPTFLKLLKEVRTTTLEAYNHQDVPFEYLVDRLAPERNMSHSPIFQVMLAWQNFVDNDLVLDSLEMEFLESSYKIAKFDMTLAVQENNGKLSGSLEYNTDLFLLETMQQFLTHFKNILSEIAEKPQQKLSALEIVSKQEQQKIVHEWNNTECDFPQDKCIHELFEEQVERTPDAIAVVCGEEQLTYRELNEKANQLAHYLLKQGLKPGDYIAVIINRSQEMVISILAILKSSGVYIPIDPESPIERLTFILENAKPKIVITQKKYFSTLKNTNAKIFFVEDKNDTETTDNVVNKNVDANKPCYIIYTSGSTGLPKGSIVYHKNIISLFVSTQKSFNFSEKDTWSLFHSFAFDFSVWEMWGALLHGGKLIIVPHWISRSSSEFYSLLKKEQVTILNQTPSAFEQLSNVVDFDKTNLNVRLVIFGGEELIFQKLQKWQECFDNINFVNMYGITETTVHVSIHQINKEDLKSTKSIIGKAINLWSIYILDRFMSFVPIGVCGEIYVGGAGLAQGYINRPGLTAERFVPHPFSKKEGERLYKTGDLARYLPDGNIEFIGRKDHQVKVRGFRIELGEIEANLLEHKNVKETVAIVREDTAENKMIVAYIVVSSKENTNIEDLRNYLKNKLPEYMIPSAFVVLDKLPLTPNGKVDRKALPKPDFAIEKMVKAKTPVEEIIVNVWQKLLALENVGVEDNFFHVGGHSLLATQLVSRLSKTLQKEISIRDVFLYPTIREIAAHLEKKNRTIEKLAITKADRSQNLPLSFAQQRLWFLDKLEGASANYNMPGALKFIGKLDIAKLEKALQYIVMRHEVLRTHFIEVENGVVQVIHNDAFTLQIKENTNLEEIHSQIEIETHRPFDLGKDTLLRAIVYKVAEEDWVLFVNMHHIISDGWSIGIFMRELATLYNALQKKDTCELGTVLPALKIQYADFALWQREWLQGKVLEQQLGYWQQQLANIPTMLDLPTDKPRPVIQTYNGDHIVFEIEPEVTIKLQQLCNEEGVTMFMCVYAAFACLLARYSNQEDIVIGTPIANRNIEETEELIGFFVNTLALRVNLANNPTFLELLKEVRTTTLEAYNHQDVPFEYLVDRLAPERNMSHSPIFQVMLAWQNFAENDLVLDNLEIEVVESPYKIAKFDMTLAVQESDGRLRGSLEYNTDLFLLETMQQFLTHFKNILSEIAEKPQQKLSALEIVSKQEQQKIVHEWNNTECDFPQDKCIHELFEEQVERTPDAIAVVCGEEQLTYRELNEKANQLAHYLLKQGLKPGDYIAVIINRSQEMVISILAILKSSGVYIPIDPESPIERLTFILENAKPKIVITQKKYFSTLKNTNAKIFFVEDKNDTETTDNVVNKNVDANKPCYIIYTSGSTGLPKGSIVYHKNIISLFVSTQKSFNFSEKDTWSLFHSFAFDFSVWEMWGALLHGGKLIIVPHWISRSSSEFYSLLKKEQVTILNQTPSAFEQLSNVVDFDKTNLNVRLVIFGGEELIFQKLQKWQECFDNINFVNMYGITETTVHVSIHQINKEDLKSTKSIIGKAINLWSIYILDRFMSFVPIGVCGEIYVGGAGLAQGYINRPGLTAERFVPHPFSKKEGERLYKTGDLARYLPDGNIEFIGRKDHQVKVRGFRIELGEIEANLLEHKNVKETVVIVREDTTENKMIVAYIVVSDKENTDIEDLRSCLKNKLPEYMIPSAFVVLDKLPLTPNGKVDRKALPKPDFAIEKVVKARTPVEEIIVNVWQKLLTLENVGVEDNFFHVGGHSLLATQLVSRLSKTLQKEISIRDVFLYPTIREMATHLEKKNRTIEKFAITKADRSQNLPLSFAQQRLWFLDKLEGASANYNMPGALKLIGKLDIAKLEKALQCIVMRHEVLRTHFIEVENGAVQVIHNDAFTLQVEENTNLEEIYRQIEIETHRPFDLGKDMLLRAIVYKVTEEEWILFVNMHHITSDGWSIGIFMRELATLYNALQQKDTCELDTVLPALKVQYADFALWQREWLQGNVLDTQLGYWQQQLANIPTMLDLPTDKPRPAIQTYNGDHIGFEIEPEITQKLQQLCNEEGVTMFMCVYAAFACLLARYSNQEDVVIGTPIANRNIEETEELIGFFVNTLALRVNLANNPTFLELLKEVRTTTLEAYNHQDVPFEYLVDRLAPERNMSHSPIFQVMLAWQNFVDNDLVLDSLEMEFLESSYKIAKFDMTLAVQENNGKLSGSLEYNTDLFLLETMQQFLTHFKNILSEIAEKPQQKLSALEIVSKQEQQKIVHEWNNTECDFPQDKCIHELFEEQVERTPDAIAVVCGEEQLTYRELNEKANQLAHYLLKQGLKPGDYIAVIINRSQEMVISILAILKSSGVYIPIDPESPIERLTFILENAKPKIVITQKKYFSTLKNTNAKIFFVEDKNDTETTDNVVNKNVDANKPCYIIYTSGSTGLPKGSIVYHKNIISLFVSTQKSFNFSEKDTWSLFHSFAFDFSVWEMWGALLHGGKLIIVPHWISRSSSEFYSLLKKEQVTILNQTPSAFEQLSNVVDFDKTNLNVRLVIFGGEELIFQKLQKWQECFDNINFVNMYGITETTVHVSIHQINKEDLKSTKSIIGKAINLWSIYILDRFMSFVPIGVCGEIYVGGAGLAQGYINRPGLTAERFVPHPFSKKEGERLYKTGDLARYLPDGNIEFIGRKDHQVKVRGFRIELGEIEANLLEHKNVKETVAIVREDTAENKMIVAYIVVSSKENTNIEDLRNYLKNKLPEYMIPSAFVVLDKLPLTPNGKVDRKALPKPDFAIEKMVKAKTPVEEIIVNVWQKLLALENVGVEDNFFHVGGHSLLATQLVSRLSKTLQKEISIRDVFLYPTIREIAAHLEKKNRTIEKLAITKADRSQNLPLSFAQQRLWFLDKLEGASANYNMPGALKFIGKLDIAKLEKALQYIVMRHEVLRTHFIEVENGVVQVIHNDAFTLQIKENTNLEEIHSQIEIETHRPFDLGKDTLLRAIVYKVAEEDWVLFVNMHHIISDGWSIGIFMRELATLYNALQKKDTCELGTVLPALKIQYADFALWQREWLQGKVLEQQLGYWQQQLANIPTMLDLPTDKPRPVIQTYNGDHIVFEIEPEVTIKLQQLCNEEGVTMFMCVYAAFACLLARYSNQEDIVIGTPIANRNIEETEELIGFFVNTLALRVNLANNPTFLELLKEVRTTTLEAYNHQDVPFEYLVDRLAPERNMSHSPIFQVMLAWQNFAENDLVLDNLEIEVVESPYKIAKFDMTLAVQESDGRLRGSLEYNTDLFLLETMQQFLVHFKNILSQIVEKPQQEISSLEILSKQEQQKIVYEWNNTECDYPQDKCIHELFEEQVDKTPDAIAVVCGEEQLTYRELNEKANQLAHYLLKQGLKPGDYIAVIINRSQEMVISILAILKSSGVYIPLDPESPIERLTFILENAKPKIVITQKKYFSTLKNTNAKIFFVEDKNDTETTDNVVNKNVDANKPCYIIYTSGSTGLPKGSIVYHKNIISLFVSTQKSFNFSEKDTWSLFHSFAFDFSVWEMWGALLHGGKLIIVPHWISRSSSEFYSLLKKEQVTILNQTPSAFEQLSNVVDFDKTNLNVRLVIFGGEELIFQKLQKWQECFDNINFVNMYGITETTVHVSIHQINKEDLKSTKSIIGKAVSLWSIYILDRFMSFVPIGVCGEIYVGGAGLAQGYINKPGLTAERFIPNLFSKKEGERLYKTGDLARYLPDGNIEFIGRKDHQVKVRGFRIELGEIEANLLEHKNVKETVVIVREDTTENKMIVAYIVVSDKENTNIEDLRNYLKNKLPEYMIPSAFVVLDKLPLTPNGKVDRKALPKPDFSNNEIMLPRNEVEAKLVGIWQDVLKLEKVSIQDNFFHIGGHSLLAVQLISKINRHFQIELPLQELFKNPTIAKLSQILQYNEKREWSPVISFPSLQQNNPFFCFPGMGGTILYLYDFLQTLSSIQLCYGLQALGFDGCSEPHKNLEEMAEYYIGYMKKIQPSGPYTVGGHSLGGKIAFEVARQLYLQGDKITKLIIIDTTPEMDMGEDYDDAQLLCDVASLYEEFYGQDLKITKERLQNLTWQDKIAEVHTEFVKAGLLPNDKDTRYLENHLNIYRAQSKISYKPEKKKYPIPTILYRAQQNENIGETTLTWGWSEYTDDVEVICIPGTHITMMARDNNKDIIEHLKKILEKDKNKA